MPYRGWLQLFALGTLGISLFPMFPLRACCPAPPSGKAVVNADQTVIILWDAAAKMQHFIRKASFKSAADDFGFLVPTPAQPELNESGNEAFAYLQRLTEPERRHEARPSSGFGCGGTPKVKEAKSAVRVLEEKIVAGFKAAVLEADSATALTEWLKKNDYAYSPEIEAWAKPYVASGWKFTALKIARGKSDKADPNVTASALRISFKTDRPLFPYREPDSAKSAAELGTKNRLLRIYFLAKGRFRGDLTKESPWTGKVAWAGAIGGNNFNSVREMLKLEKTPDTADWWLTEFEDAWPYQQAPADLYFSRDVTQHPLKRPPIIEYSATAPAHDHSLTLLAITLAVPPLWRRLYRRRRN